MTELLQDQCKEFIIKTNENPKWANNQLMEFVLFQKNRVERREIVDAGLIICGKCFMVNIRMGRLKNWTIPNTKKENANRSMPRLCLMSFLHFKN